MRTPFSRGKNGGGTLCRLRRRWRSYPQAFPAPPLKLPAPYGLRPQRGIFFITNRVTRITLPKIFPLPFSSMMVVRVIRPGAEKKISHPLEQWASKHIQQRTCLRNKLWADNKNENVNDKGPNKLKRSNMCRTWVIQNISKIIIVGNSKLKQ